MRNLIKQVLREGEPGPTGGSSLASAFSTPSGGAVPPVSAPPASGTPTQFTPGPMWTKAKEVFGIEAPQDLTQETELDRFFQVVKEKAIPPAQSAPQIHPVAMELNQRLQDPTFKMDEWVQRQSAIANMDKLEGKEFLKAYFTNEFPDASPEKITSIVDSIEKGGQIELQELQYKKAWKTAREQEALNLQNAQQQNFQKAIQEENSRVQNELKTLFANTQNFTEIYGVKVSKAELDAFNSTFSELVTRDETGAIPLFSLLQSNEDIYRFAFMAINGDQKIKAALTSAKEGTKASILKALRREATPQTGVQSQQQVPGQAPNWNSFTQPQK
jgi:predicted SnoaL-like aldol condensation-catalyzing enzyme